MARSVRLDHVQNYRFRVSIRPEDATEGELPFPDAFASFLRVSIPSLTLETEDWKEGTWFFRRRVITGASLDTFTLERGVTRADSGFWLWATGALGGEVGRVQLIIQLLHRTREPALPPGRQAERMKSAILTGGLNVAGSELVSVQLNPTVLAVAKEWRVHEAIPVRVKPASDLDATSPEVSIAELEVHGNWMEQTSLVPFPGVVSEIVS